MASFPTGTVTMLFTDIEGSTRLLKQLGEDYGALLADHRRLLREGVRASSTAARWTPRAMLSSTPSPAPARPPSPRSTPSARLPRTLGPRGQSAASAWACTPASRAWARRATRHRPPSRREVAHGARGGQILVSPSTAQLLEDDLPPGVTLRDLGERELKDIDRPVRLYQLEAEGLRTDFSEPRPRHRRYALAAAAAILVAAVVAAVVLLAGGGSGSPEATAAGVAADSIGILRPSTGHRTGQIDVGASPSALAAGAGSVWAANVDRRSVFPHRPRSSG